MPEVPHDATVALRLELGRERDRANAFEAALRKEVLAIVREEIRKAIVSADPLMREAVASATLAYPNRSNVGKYTHE